MSNWILELITVTSLVYILISFCKMRCYLTASREPYHLNAVYTYLHKSNVAVQLCLKNLFSQVEVICLFCACVKKRLIVLERG